MSYIYGLVDTWASGGGPYTSIKMNATDNDSGSASLLMDLQVGAVSKFRVSKAGEVTVPSSGYLAVSGGNTLIAQTYIRTIDFACESNTGVIRMGASGDVRLTRRAAANWRFGDADAAAPVAQTLSVQSVVAGTTNTAGANLTITGSQGTGTGAGGSIIFQVAPAGGAGSAQNTLATALQIVSTSAATTTFQFWQPSAGTTRSVELITCDNSGARVGGIISNAATGEVRFGCFNAGGYYTTFYSNNAERWQINTSGHFLASADNTYDIGASGATRPRDIYAGNALWAPGGGYLGFYGRAALTAPTGGTDLTLNNGSFNGFGKLNFGGTTSSFPALKRSTTTLQARLADDSAFASVQGKLTTDTAYTAGAIVVTGYLTLYDSTGTAYRVPCVV